MIFLSPPPPTCIEAEETMSTGDTTAAFCLLLPGKTLYLTPLLNAKKFRSHGNKDGAVRAFFQLEREKLGNTRVIGSSRANPVRINNHSE